MNQNEKPPIFDPNQEDVTYSSPNEFEKIVYQKFDLSMSDLKTITENMKNRDEDGFESYDQELKNAFRELGIKGYKFHNDEISTSLIVSDDFMEKYKNFEEKDCELIDQNGLVLFMTKDEAARLRMRVPLLADDRKFGSDIGSNNRGHGPENNIPEIF